MEIQIKQFIGYLQAERNLSPGTIKIYSKDLGRFDKFMNGREVNAINRQDIRDYLSELVDINLPVTRARKLSCIKSFFKFLARESIINLNPADSIEMPKLPQKEPDFLSESEYKRLLEAVRRYSTPYYKSRDLAIMHLFLGCGLRVSELINIRVESIDFTDQLLKIHRKGDREQIIPVSDIVVALLRAYLKDRPEVEYESFFISRQGTPLRANSVYSLVRKYLVLASIKKDKMGCHLLRHSFCTALLNKGVNLVAIQELAGHKNLETTRKYLHINSVDLKNAVEQISF